MTNPFGFVVMANSPFEETKLERYLKANRPPSLTVLNNPGYAFHLKTNIVPNTAIYCRNYDGDGDENDWQQYSPTDYLSKYRNQTHDGLLGLQIWNEPGFGKAVVDRAYEIARIALSQGISISLFGPSVGTTPDSVEKWKEYDNFVQLICNHPNKLALDVHEYFSFLPTSGMITPGAKNALHFVEKLDYPDKWPANHRELTNLYHCGRIRNLTDYCLSKGYGKPTIDIGELGHDSIGELSNFLKTLPVYGRTTIRGWKTVRTAWESKFPKLPFTEVYATMLKWLWSSVYKPIGVRSVRLFCFGQGNGWEDFDCNNDDLLNSLSEWVEGPSIPTYPDSNSNVGEADQKLKTLLKKLKEDLEELERLL